MTTNHGLATVMPFGATHSFLNAYPTLSWIPLLDISKTPIFYSQSCVLGLPAFAISERASEHSLSFYSTIVFSLNFTIISCFSLRYPFPYLESPLRIFYGKKNDTH